MRQFRSEPSEPNALQLFGASIKKAVEAQKAEAANEAAGRQGMNGPTHSIRSFEDSPLFGSSQKSLFDKEEV